MLRPTLSRIRKHHGAANYCILKTAILSPENAISPSSSKNKSSEKGYVLFYLMNACGLSAKNASCAAKKVHFDGPEKPNAVLNFLEKQGFNKTQISEIVRRRPQLLVSRPEESLSPKIDFFLNLTGISEEDVRATLSRYPFFLITSLEGRIAPVYNYIEGVLGAAKARALFINGSPTLKLDPEILIPNVDLLRTLGVPPRHIEFALCRFPLVVCSKHVQLRRIVEEVMQLGFDPKQSMFIMAINALIGKGNVGLWDECYRAYSKWGWSNDDIYTAFRKHPWCMLISEKKISTALDFLVNRLGLDPRSVVYCPYVLLYSMKRIVPRCSIVNLLCLKGFVTKHWSLSSVLCPVEKDFVERYVTRFADELPQIYDIYQQKLGLKLETHVLSDEASFLQRNNQIPVQPILNNGGPAVFSPETAISPSSTKNKLAGKEYVVSYLVNSIGLSVENAVSASRKVHFDVPDKPNVVLNLLQEQGFSKTQIAELVGRQPQLLVLRPEKSLSPKKIELLVHLTGISEKDVLATLSRYPSLLKISEDRLATIYNYIEHLIGDVKARALFMEGSWTFTLDPETFTRNVDFLSKHGVPLHYMESALFNHPLVFSRKHVEFRRMVEEVKQLGFDPLKSKFVLAIYALRGKGNAGSWDRCYGTYSKWGWSEDDIYNAFRKHPLCMLKSEKKISTTLDFLVNQLGLDPRAVAYCPIVLFYSMEKRIIPRCSIVRLLCLKGLVKKDWSLSGVLVVGEKDFVERYVSRFAEEVPQIYDIYQEKLGVGLSSKVKKAPE